MCDLLDSQLYAGALNVLIPTPISSFPTSSFPCFPVYLFLVPTVISCSRFLWPILLPLLFANSPWEAAPALGMLQMRWNKDSPPSVVPARLVERQNHKFLRRRSILPLLAVANLHHDHCWLGAWNMVKGQFQRPWHSLNKYSAAASSFISFFSGCNVLTSFLEKLKADSEVFASLFLAFGEQEDHGESYSAIFCDTTLFVHLWYIY